MKDLKKGLKTWLTRVTKRRLEHRVSFYLYSIAIVRPLTPKMCNEVCWDRSSKCVSDLFVFCGRLSDLGATYLCLSYTLDTVLGVTKTQDTLNFCSKETTHSGGYNGDSGL